MPGCGNAPSWYIKRLTQTDLDKQAAIGAPANMPGGMEIEPATVQEQEAWWHISERDGTDIIGKLSITHFIQVTHGKSDKAIV